MQSSCKPYIWLHIKKAGGQSMRSALGDNYRVINRYEKKHFSELPKEAWNDCLNNYRISLNDYDFRRMLYAKKFLYSKEEFSGAFKFAVVRDPFDRALSCWRYLAQNKLTLNPARLLRRFSFEYFLKSLPEIWEDKKDRQLALHTAPIWPDITDESGILLLNYIARLETIDRDMEKIFETLGIPQQTFPHINKSGEKQSRHSEYSKTTRLLVEKYYSKDIENLGYRF